MTAYGTFPLGTNLGPFGGPGLITVLGVLPLSNNSFVVVFDVDPYVLDEEAIDSAVNLTNYTLAAVDPTYTSATTPAPGIVPAGAVVPTRFPLIASAIQDSVDHKQVVISTDAAMDPTVTYSLDINPSIAGEACETFAGLTTWRFKAPKYPLIPGAVELVEERWRDFDWRPYGEDGLSAYVQEASTDIGIQGGAESLRKRIYRRIFTDRGGFAWAPAYGVGVHTKKLMRGGYLQEVASAVAEQVRQEPDVVDVGVEVSMVRNSTGAFLEIDVRVKSRDSRMRTMLFRQPAG